MKCIKCEYHFCWICLESWNNHNAETGGFYNCNLFVLKKGTDTNFAAEEEERKAAGREIKRYEYYSFKFFSHEQSQRKAINTNEEIWLRMSEMINHF